MMVTGFFMFGFDFDNIESFDKTLQAIYNWGLDEVSFSIVTPYPGTRLFQRYDQEGRIICRDWSKYGEGNVNYKLKGLTDEELLKGIKKVAMDYYSIPNNIKRSFTNTNHRRKASTQLLAFLLSSQCSNAQSFFVHLWLFTPCTRHRFRI